MGMHAASSLYEPFSLSECRLDKKASGKGEEKEFTYRPVSSTPVTKFSLNSVVAGLPSENPSSYVVSLFSAGPGRGGRRESL